MVVPADETDNDIQKASRCFPRRVMQAVLTSSLEVSEAWDFRLV